MPTSARMLGTTCIAPVGHDDLGVPLRRTTCLASVGRGDHTPGAPRRHRPAPPPVGSGLRPAPLGKASFQGNFRWFRNASGNRVGADLCVRPDTPLRGTRHGPTHRSAPTDPIATSINLGTTGGGRALPLPVYRGALLRAPEGWASHRCQSLCPARGCCTLLIERSSACCRKKRWERVRAPSGRVRSRGSCSSTTRRGNPDPPARGWG